MQPVRPSAGPSSPGGAHGMPWRTCWRTWAPPTTDETPDHEDRWPDRKAGDILDQIDGTATPFAAARIDAWEAQLGLGAREASMYASDVRAFIKEHPVVSVQALDGGLVQRWLCP
jgi:hypothetical protein